MKPSHLKTPRTMNEGIWMSGYQSGSVGKSPIAEDVASILVAVAIGIGLAALLVAWWSS